MKYLRQAVRAPDSRFMDATHPRLLVISGLHGNESNAVAVTAKLAKDAALNPESLFVGNNALFREIVFLVGVNEPGLRKNVRECEPISDKDQKDLNRKFFEASDYDYPAMIKREIESCDIVLDVHNSPNIANLMLIQYDRYAMQYRREFIKAGIQSLVWNRDTNTTKNYAHSLGKAGFTAELNGMAWEGSYELNVKWLRKVIKNLAHLRWPQAEEPDPKVLSCPVRNQFEGLVSWDPTFLGQSYRAGEAIAEIEDFSGRLLETIVAPVAGVLVEGPESRFAAVGSDLFTIDPAEQLPIESD